MMPASATGTPYNARSKIPILGSLGNCSCCLPATTRLVDVPMSVMVPPRMEA